ncbi:MAG: hypothetical protein K8L91_01535 [Anaerolineae bacterium]|nr:hypothetical protein [Anaerolineae bacterium]
MPPALDDTIRYLLKCMLMGYEGKEYPITLYSPYKYAASDDLNRYHKGLIEMERTGLVRIYVLQHHPMRLGAEFTSFGLQRARELRKQKK